MFFFYISECFFIISKIFHQVPNQKEEHSAVDQWLKKKTILIKKELQKCLKITKGQKLAAKVAQEDPSIVKMTTANNKEKK